MKRLRTAGVALLTSFFCSGIAYSADPLILDLTTNDLVASNSTGMVYASIPGTAGITYGNSVVEINPNDGYITQVVPVGSEPSIMALSDDGSTLYVALDGTHSVQKINLYDMTTEEPVWLGADSTFGPYTAEDIDVDPHNPNVIAVSLKTDRYSPRHRGVIIIQDGQVLPNSTPGHTGSNTIEFLQTPNAGHSQLVGYNNETTEFGLRKLSVNQDGVYQDNVWQQYISGFGIDIYVSGNVVYSTSGKAVDMTGDPLTLGQFPLSRTATEVIVDDITQTAYFLVGNQIELFELDRYVALDQILLPTISSDSTDDLVMFQPDKFAVRAANGDQIIFVDASPGDQDGDGIPNFMDNCPNDFNPQQIDSDLDNIGDICDPYPHDADHFGACLEESQYQRDIIDTLNNDIQQLQSALNSCQAEKQDLTTTITQLQTINSQLQTENQQLKDELTELKNSIDTDNDGVPDYLDLCPKTKRNRTVDENGCD